MISRSSNSRRLSVARAAAAVAALIAAGCWGGGARAADLGGSWLRGSFLPSTPGWVRWDGWVGGATLGYSNMSTDFGNAGSSDISYILRNSTLENEFQPSSWTTLPKTVTDVTQYGGFLGYNWQMEQLVLGFDLAYNRPSSLYTQATDSIERLVSTSDGVNHDVLLQSTASLELVDYGTIRGRAGYAFGQFLPYAAIGLAVGRFNYTTSATVTDTMTGAQTGTFGPVTQTSAQDNVIMAGFEAALGMDVAIMPNVFLRGEWEYIAWGPVNSIKSNLNTGRVGLAVRF
jgi:outer membrane immunogenic protein